MGSEDKRWGAGCEPDCGHGYYCNVCTDRIKREVWARMTPGQKEYDRMVDPLRVYHTDYDRHPSESEECSCHINPPCGYCTREWDCDCDGNHADGHALGCEAGGE